MYQTICEANGKSYVGVHSTDNMNDGYIGCGVYRQNDANRHMLFHRAVRKYGYASFRRRILSFYDTYEEALEEEKFIVNEAWVKNKNNYNSAIGGEGNTTSWMDDERKEKWKSNIKEATQKWYENGGLEKIRAAAKTAKKTRRFGSDNVMFGQHSVRRRRIIKYDINWNKLDEFSSVTDAANDISSYPSQITICCKGRTKTCNGFIYRYSDSNAEELERLNLNMIRKKKTVKKKYKLSSEHKRKISEAHIKRNSQRREIV